jgi:hypothetical protein
MTQRAHNRGSQLSISRASRHGEIVTRGSNILQAARVGAPGGHRAELNPAGCHCTRLACRRAAPAITAPVSGGRLAGGPHRPQPGGFSGSKNELGPRGLPLSGRQTSANTASSQKTIPEGFTFVNPTQKANAPARRGRSLELSRGNKGRHRRLITDPIDGGRVVPDERWPNGLLTGRGAAQPSCGCCLPS